MVPALLSAPGWSRDAPERRMPPPAALLQRCCRRRRPRGTRVTLRRPGWLMSWNGKVKLYFNWPSRWRDKTLHKTNTLHFEAYDIYQNIWAYKHHWQWGHVTSYDVLLFYLISLVMMVMMTSSIFACKYHRYLHGHESLKRKKRGVWYVFYGLFFVSKSFVMVILPFGTRSGQVI